MVSAIKQYGIVGKEGKVEVSANLPEGTKVEIIILVEATVEAKDETTIYSQPRPTDSIY